MLGIMTDVQKSYRLKRLIYQSNHRGCKELDIVLGSFANLQLSLLSDAELDSYEELCLEDEWQIYYWITGDKEAPQQFKGIILLIQQFINKNKICQQL